MRSCPQCTSQRVWKDGLRKAMFGDVQRFVCRDCGYRFSDKTLNRAFKDRFQRQICVSPERKAKNLVEVEPLKEGPRREATEDAKGRIIEYLWYLKKQGRKENTLKGHRKVLTRLTKQGANLQDPETIKETIAREKVSVNTKSHYVGIYTVFARWANLHWNPPQYKAIRKIPFIPTETEIDQLIAAFKTRTATFLQLLKETMGRAGEIWALEWVDRNANILTINAPEKGSYPRQFKLSERLNSMLNILPKKDKRIFGPQTSINNFRTNYYRRRKYLARKLGNPRIEKITFHTFRHWGATMLYHKTKDILYVQKKLGHRCIENTMIYTQLINFESDEWHVAHAETLEEEDKLIEAGFEFVRYDDKERIALYRKRK